MSGWRTAATLVPWTARAPGSWLALASAAGCGWLLGSAGGAAGTAACGGLVAVAAIGDPPAAWRGQAGSPATVCLVRAAWPIAGCLAVALVRLALGQHAPAVGAAAVAGWAAAVTVLLAARHSATRQSAARAAALARAGLMPIASAALAASAAAVVAPPADGWSPWLAACLAFGTVAVGERLTLARVAADETGPTGLFGGPTAAGPVAANLSTTLAMAASLAGMVLFLFLLPGAARAYTLLVASLFICLAVPQATGPAGGRAGRGIVAAAAGRPAAPGSLGQAARVAAVHVALLGWPAIVAAALDPSRAAGPAESLACLAALALVTLAAVAGCRGSSGRKAGKDDSPRAVVLCLVAIAVAAGLRGPLGGLAGGPNPLPSPAASPGRGSVLSDRPVPATLPQSSHPAPPAGIASRGALP